MRHFSLRQMTTVLLTITLTASIGLGQHHDLDDVEIQTLKAADNIYMLTGQGGNMGICVGKDGVLLIDNQFAPLTEKITASIAAVSDQKIRFLINTHWHFDHTGGNENFGKTGAVIVAHQNVRQRLSRDQFIAFFDKAVPATKAIGLPIVTFTQDLTFHLNNEEIYVYHPPHAHTDGDAIVHFKTSNVIHTGDLYFAGMYPFFDAGAGGTITGIIDGIDHILDRINDKTQVIPGHGPLSNKVELTAYRNMLNTIYSKVALLIKEGKTLKEIQAAKPTQAFDEKWGKGLLSPDQFVQIVHTDLTKK